MRGGWKSVVGMALAYLWNGRNVGGRIVSGINDVVSNSFGWKKMQNKVFAKISICKRH